MLISVTKDNEMIKLNRKIIKHSSLLKNISLLTKEGERVNLLITSLALNRIIHCIDLINSKTKISSTLEIEYNMELYDYLGGLSNIALSTTLEASIYLDIPIVTEHCVRNFSERVKKVKYNDLLLIINIDKNELEKRRKLRK